MPHLPKWIVDSMENLMSSKFFDAHIVSIFYLNPEIVKITFKADLINMDFFPGWPFMSRVGSKDLRHYTASSFNKETGLFDIIYHLHGEGPGSDLAANIHTGDVIRMGVPAGKKMYVPESKHHFFFGDETSISFMTILINNIQIDNGVYKGILELKDENLTLKNVIDLDLEIVRRTPEYPGMNAINYLQQISNERDFPLEKTIFYLTGNVASIQAFRKELKKIDVDSKNIKLQGYWAEGSVGL